MSRLFEALKEKLFFALAKREAVMIRPLTPSEQGKRWRAAGGLFKDCWWNEGTTARLLWEKGWQEEDDRLKKQASDSKQTQDHPNAP
jgi:hypothetical protein